MKLELLKIIFFASWCGALGLSRIGFPRVILYTISLITAGGALFLQSPQMKSLSWFSCIWVAYLIASTEAKRSTVGIAQKHFILQVFGALLAIFGVALVGVDNSLILVLVGVLLVVPTFLHSILFSRFYEALTRRAYLFSVIIPSLVGIDLLLTVKPEIKQGFPIVWQSSLLGVGAMSLLSNSFLALLKNNTKSLLVFLTQSWLAVMLALLASDDLNVPLALASISVFLVSGFMIVLEGKRFSKAFSFLSLSILFGMPCFIGFNAIFYSIKALEAFSVPVFGVFMVSVFFQVAAAVLNYSRQVGSEQKANMRFYLLCGISLVASIAIHLVGMKYALD